MKLQHAYFPALISAVVGVLLPTANADPLYKRTEVTFHDPVEIPGMVLLPGTYVMKLLDPLMDQDIVRFYDKDEKHMYAMVFAVRDYRLNPPDHTVITFEERAGDAPQAIKEWFYPGDNWGEQFVYPKAHPVAVAQAAPTPVAPTPTPAAAPRPAPPPRPVTQNQPKQPPQQVAQAQPVPVRSQPVVAAPAPAPAQQAEPTKELPKTASDLPLAALVGGFFVIAGACLRRKAA
jgi:hypothetical protein